MYAYGRTSSKKKKFARQKVSPPEVMGGNIYKLWARNFGLAHLPD
jgi:hypothetical protein